MKDVDVQPWVKNYQPGVPAEIELPTESLTAMLERSVAEAGTRPALEFFGRRTSYAELGEQVDRAAEGLRQLGGSSATSLRTTRPGWSSPGTRRPPPSGSSRPTSRLTTLSR